MAPRGADQHRWWKEATVYQIYPASFKDSNDDGWGDIKGITSKLDYLQSLGVDVLWLSPIYKSPQVDMGYDISDYKDIDPKYGTLADVDEMIAEMKKRGLKLMMDLVVNHTSDQHAWFKESRESRDSAKRDWYIWKPAKGRADDGTPLPPNNWMQLLGDGESAWTWDEATGEFYLSLFTPEQPDLNWENEAVRAAVHDVMTFWMERGAAGFRMDVINLISKVQTFPDAPAVLPPPHKYQPGFQYFANGPRLHEFLREMHDKVLERYEAITVGEMPWVDDEDEVLRVVGADRRELRMIFIFDLVNVDVPPGQPRQSWHDFSVRDIARIVTKWQEIMIRRDGWNSVFVENHDQPRSTTRYIDDSDEWRHKGSKLLALMVTTLSGTLYLYEGQEIGMRNMPPSWDIDAEYRDVDTLKFWHESQRMFGDDKERLEVVKKIIHRKARDHARTPVQWSGDAPNAGFSGPDVKTWMRVNDDYKEVNAERQVGNPDGEGVDGGITVWHFWQRGLRSRREHKDVFVYGDYDELADGSDGVFAYLRTAESGSRWLVALNFTGKTTSFAVPAGIKVAEWVAGNYGPGSIDKPESGNVELAPWEGILGRCE